ncbi:MAG: DAK2 domain-containing protein [Lachnospiraceae bacterium]|nr:DAK2 domain-containing protein [Lachnospiraceae bacterium]
MGVQEIDSKLLSKCFLAGAINLEKNKEWINELNVFPVPDGDTGTNMCMTIMSAAKEVAALGEEPDMASLCKAISGGSLRGARGNSGVILSQLLRGFTKVVKEEGIINVSVVATAFSKAVETAYKAVMKPKEGTILTVARGMSEKACDLAEDGCTDLEACFTAVLEHGRVVLDQTPDMLPVLKEAGVVDSGGQGLIEFLQGAMDAYLGKVTNFSLDAASEEKPEEAAEEKKAHKLVYCVKCVIVPDKNFIAKNEADIKNYMESIGNLVSIVNNNDLIGIHIHTNDPGLVFQKAIRFGQIKDITVYNRNLETNPKKAKKDAEASKEEVQAEEPVKPTEPAKPYGFITVAAGEGLVEIFKSLNVDYIIEGGQTMNPSTADFLDAASKVNAETIFVLPNNKNIILAANQAAELVTDKKLIVIPTKTIPQGITAVVNFIPDITPEENEETMNTEIGNVKTGQVTYAVRDTSIDGKEIHVNDFMGLGDAGLASVGTNQAKVIEELVDSMVDDSSELISIYYGADVTEEDANEICELISSKYSSVDVELQCGGQPVYYYMISVE